LLFNVETVARFKVQFTEPVNPFFKPVNFQNLGTRFIQTKTVAENRPFEWSKIDYSGCKPIF